MQRGAAILLLIAGLAHASQQAQGAGKSAASSALSGCPPGASQRPAGQFSHHIQQAIRKAGPGGMVRLSGEYTIDQTLELLDGSTLCSDEGATLTWADKDRPGLMINATRAQATRIRSLVLDGRGIAIKGDGHAIEGNLIRNVQADSPANNRWGERHGVFIVDRGDHLTIRNNIFTQIVDTGIIGHNVHRSLIEANGFVDMHEGIHLFSVANTQIRDNTGSRLRAMCIEIQGDNLPGLVVERNRFSKWHPAHSSKAYVMSVVAGLGAVIKDNVIEGSPDMSAGLEVGGDGPQVLDNTLWDANLVIADAPDALIKGNKLVRASMIKDVNRVTRGRLLIEGNTIEDAPRVGLFADEWGGYEQVTIRGNLIRKKLTESTIDFAAIVASPFRKQPVLIADNVIRFELAGRKRPVRAVCFANAGYQGNLQGMQVNGNTCDGAGVALFGDSNSLGGHIGVRYQRNKLMNLQNTITGHTDGLQAIGNELSGVAADHAKLKSP
ncbi:right-handed parallel beta-helix repeat-containing protein [Aquabacterium sp.]|jgi:Right handed beta helix region|uniref:right-handed parallel beta-helix repeat-containing protein n=1 Tax=Aquabacterium sp. TaxID=1872578 RepID=UPI002489B68D|nr:right-handed parallel beta-helix repeat-containing protein [Aquabacterium sp.]MDI1349270.1 right-handed parallel beta-helix repeat-containing protein [Aquabacterium sp.]